MKDKITGLGRSIKSAVTGIKIPKRASSIGRVKSARSSVAPQLVLRNIFIGLILLLFLVEFSFAIAIYAFKSEDKVTRAVAGVVPYPAAFTTSGIVTVSKYWKEKDYIEHFYASTQQSDVDPAELSKQILQQEAENEIIQKQSIAFKTTVSRSDIDQAMQEIYEGNGGQEQVEKALKDLYGLSVNDFRELVKVQLLRDNMNKKVIKHATVRHILIRVDEGAPQETVDAAKAKIDGYLAEIKGGLSFEEAAKKYSEDVGSNQNGGLLEPFARGDMVKEFEDTAFNTKVGEMSEPFRTSFGWHILKVESVSGYIDKSFDDWLAEQLSSNFVVYLYKN